MAMQFALILGSLVGGFSSAIAAGKIYWMERAAPPAGEVRRANLDGTGMETLVTGLGDQAFDVALDLGAGKMYWVERFPSSIRRANLDGSGIEDVTPAGELSPIGIDLDLQRGKMYWTTFSNQSQIRRANLDGTDVETIYSGPAPEEQLRGIAVDAQGGKVFWTDSGDNGRVRRVNLDGSGVQTLFTGGGPIGIDLDLVHGKIYWANFDAIRRSNLDGSAVETLISTNFPTYVALDIAGGKFYWSGYGPARIQRANLDGTGVETLIMGGEPTGIEVDPEASVGITVNVDIKPQACPNPINMKMRSGNAVIPTAILGSPAFDVTDIDPSTVTLEGVPALRSSIEDVSTPLPPDPEDCECTTEGSDGIPDLVLHFNYVALVQALGPQQNGAIVPVTVSGQLKDGTPFTGLDCFLIHHGVTVLHLAGQSNVVFAGSAVEIEWEWINVDLNPSEAAIYLSTDGGVAYPITVATSEPVDGSFTWTVPGIETQNARIQVVLIDPEVGTAADESDASFEISRSSTGAPDAAGVPSILFLGRTVPQPFSGTATVRFGLPAQTRAELAVYDVDGRMVKRLATGELPAGTWERVWDGYDDAGRKVPSGTYFLRLSTPAGTETQRMTLLR
jgi:DNA-binding beta-propeller fold protein YncE